MGGAANAETLASSNKVVGGLTVVAKAQGGKGGGFTALGQPGGKGGDAAASARLTGAGANNSVGMTINATGGDGGDSLDSSFAAPGRTSGGAGGGATANGDLSVSNANILRVSAQSQGGAGGNGAVAFNALIAGSSVGGAGGAASTNLNVNGPAGAQANISAVAQGGRGGYGAVSGVGGAAASHVVVTSAAQSLSVDASAAGGVGASGSAFAPRIGAPNERGGATAFGRVNATAPGALVVAGANAQGGGAAPITARMEVAGGGSGSASASAFRISADSAHDFGAKATAGIGATSIANASVSSGDSVGVTRIAAGQASSKVVLAPNNLPGFMLGGDMSIGYGGTGQSLTYQTSFTADNLVIRSLADPTIPASNANSHLNLILLQNSVLGRGFDSAKLTVLSNGVDIFAQSFTSVAGAENFFLHNRIDLGLFQTIGHFEIDFSLTGSAVNSGFAFDWGLAVGQPLIPPAALEMPHWTQDSATAAPEPATWAMMLAGFAALGLAGRRRLRERPALA